MTQEAALGIANIKFFLVLAGAIILAGCGSSNVKQSYFVSQRLDDRSILDEFDHHGPFFIYYDRERKIAYGYLHNSNISRKFISRSFKSIPDYSRVDFGSSCVFYDECGSLRNTCTVDFLVENIENFDDIFLNIRRLGYPVKSLTYFSTNNKNQYLVNLSYFKDCEYIHSDSKNIKFLFFA